MQAVEGRIWRWSEVLPHVRNGTKDMLVCGIKHKPGVVYNHQQIEIQCACNAVK